MGENYNKSKKENPEVKQCPQEKVEYIKDALRHFELISKTEKVIQVNADGDTMLDKIFETVKKPLNGDKPFLRKLRILRYLSLIHISEPTRP